MSKRVYVLLFFVFAISIFLLGLSYSKDSGNDMELKINEKIDKYFRVVYSTSDVLTSDMNKVDFSVTNVTDKNQDYVIKLINKGDTEVYYSLDGEKERILDKEVIFTSSLTKYGTDGDYALHRLSVKGEDRFNVSLSIGKLDRSLKTYIFNSDDVFKDNNGNFRYFGDNVDNYLKYNNKIYQIIGVFGNKIRLVSDFSKKPVMYVASKNYLSVDDYLLSFDKHDLNVKNTLGNKSWLDAEYRYWLESDQAGLSKMVDADVGVRDDYKGRLHYERVVTEIDSNCNVIKGNGSVSNPYEVSYGS